MSRAIILLVLLLCSCQKKVSYQAPVASQLEQRLNSSLQVAKSGGRNQYKNIAESALLQTYSGHEEKAAEAYDQAYKLSEAHYSRSLRELTFSKILNESVKTFRPHYLEKWHLLLMASLNRWSMGDNEGAAVELRRLSRDIRLEKDPFGEKRSNEAKQAYLSFTGLIFYALERGDESFSDLHKAYSYGKDDLDDDILRLYHYLSYTRGKTKDKPAELPDYLQDFLQNRSLIVRLKDQGPQKEERRLSLTMVEYWPVIHGYMQESSAQEQKISSVEDVVLGTLGRRVISIAYPVFVSRCSPALSAYEHPVLNYDELLLESWQLQRNRLIAQNILRVTFKVIASQKVSSLIEDNVGGGWGTLLGNLGAMAVWKTEKADIRQLFYLPAQLMISFPRAGKLPNGSVKLRRQGLF
ncbi:MAG: hypothetical protein HQL32_13910 [Planctomycetes bacterium]|nr:hypothetical protein [Planctomycetota bacterium]